MVSVVFAIGAIFNILLTLAAPKILQKQGLLRLTLGLTTLEMISLLCLAFPVHPAVAILAFFIHTATASLLLYCMDMFLEHYSKPEEIGSMRGMFLTMWGIPPIITPFIAGLIIDHQQLAVTGGNVLEQVHNLGFWKIYLISAVFLVPFMFILKVNFSGMKDLQYPRTNVIETIRHFMKHRSIVDVFIDRFLLNLYFAWTVVYIPIYLHDYIGFSWDEIGIMISIMLLPFVLLQRVVGRMQDRKPHEKSLMVAGFLIMAIGAIIMPFITTKSIVGWTIILFITHVGASIIEVASESYFFKHVSPTNSGFISLFRITRTLPYIIMPPIMAIILSLMPFGYMFLVLGIIMLLGVRYALMIR